MRVRQLAPEKFYKLFASPLEAPQCRTCGSREISIGSTTIQFDVARQKWDYMDGGCPFCYDCQTEVQYEFTSVDQWYLFDNFFQLEDA